jgi:transposase
MKVVMKKQLGTEGGTPAELEVRQMRAIHALLTGVSVDKAAKDAHIGKTTLYRWLKDDTFWAAYQAARKRPQEWARHRLRCLAAKAVQILEQLLEDATLPASTKVEAARIVLSLAGTGAQLIRDDLVAPEENHHQPQSVVAFTAPPQANGVRRQGPAILGDTSSDIR